MGVARRRPRDVEGAGADVPAMGGRQAGLDRHLHALPLTAGDLRGLRPLLYERIERERVHPVPLARPSRQRSDRGGCASGRIGGVGSRRFPETGVPGDPLAKGGGVKIVYLITRADAVGGASIHVRDLATAFLDRGHDVTVVMGGEGPVSEQMAAGGIPVRSLRYLSRPLHPWNDTQALVEVSGALQGLRPDLVSTHTAKAG